MKSVLIVFVSVLLFFNTSNACSMYKITRDGKTIVGNNEDWISLNTKMWFEPAGNKKYGVMNVGFFNNFAQGGINEAGLMFDGFAMPYLEVKNTEGKINISLGQAVQNVMHSSASVREAKDYLSTVNLSALASGMIVFVDRTGEYLIVEGDELILGNDAEQSFSNFYPSKTKSREEVDIPFYQNGLKYLKNSTAQPSINYCSSVMDNLGQKRTSQLSVIATQYSNIFDLENLTIRFYHYSNYDNPVDIDLKKELQKGKHEMIIPELFPKNTEGYQTYLKYNDAESPASFLKACLAKDIKGKSEKDIEFCKETYAQFINTIGYEWLYDMKNAKGAIAIFKYGTELLPTNANLFDSLGEGFFEDENYKEAIENYKKSLALNPQNSNATKMIEKIKEKQKLEK